MSVNLKILSRKPGSPPPWYSEGIRFACTGSGKCCTARGDYEFVFVSRAEERRIAAHLGLSLREFRRRYTKRAGMGERSLRFPRGRCTFLLGTRCSIYEARPRQCRTWPFWPENMDRGLWEREIATFCPGIGRGRRYTAQEIEAVLEDQGDAAE